MTAYQDNWEKIFGKKKVKPKIIQPLRSTVAYWDPDKPDIVSALSSNVDSLDKESLISLVRELDRRFIQLWDKVSFEQEHGLLDYEKLVK